MAVAHASGIQDTRDLPMTPERAAIIAFVNRQRAAMSQFVPLSATFEPIPWNAPYCMLDSILSDMLVQLPSLMTSMTMSSAGMSMASPGVGSVDCPSSCGMSDSKDSGSPVLGGIPPIISDVTLSELPLLQQQQQRGASGAAGEISWPASDLLFDFDFDAVLPMQ